MDVRDALVADLTTQRDQLLAALRAAERVLAVALRTDLPGWEEAERTAIIDGHGGMREIRAAIARASPGSR